MDNMAAGGVIGTPASQKENDSSKERCSSRGRPHRPLLFGTWEGGGGDCESDGGGGGAGGGDESESSACSDVTVVWNPAAGGSPPKGVVPGSLVVPPTLTKKSSSGNNFPRTPEVILQCPTLKVSECPANSRECPTLRVPTLRSSEWCFFPTFYAPQPPSPVQEDIKRPPVDNIDYHECLEGINRISGEGSRHHSATSRRGVSPSSPDPLRVTTGILVEGYESPLPRVHHHRPRGQIPAPRTKEMCSLPRPLTPVQCVITVDKSVSTNDNHSQEKVLSAREGSFEPQCSDLLCSSTFPGSITDQRRWLSDGHLRGGGGGGRIPLPASRSEQWGKADAASAAASIPCQFEGGGGAMNETTALRGPEAAKSLSPVAHVRRSASLEELIVRIEELGPDDDDRCKGRSLRRHHQHLTGVTDVSTDGSTHNWGDRPVRDKSSTPLLQHDYSGIEVASESEMEPSDGKHPNPEPDKQSEGCLATPRRCLRCCWDGADYCRGLCLNCPDFWSIFFLLIDIPCAFCFC